jgi:hypothetical protein
LISKGNKIAYPPVSPDEITMLMTNLQQNSDKVYFDAENRYKEQKRKEEEERKKKEEEEKKKKEEEERKKKEEEEKKKKEEEGKKNNVENKNKKDDKKR